MQPCSQRAARARSDRGPGRGGVRLDLGPPMKVLAAMSGGVDSAVAAARAVDAGHDVTGVHLALSKNPQSFRSGARGCCSARGRPRRPPGRRRAGHSRSTSGISPTGSPPTWSTTSSPSTPPAAPRTRACAATRRSSSPRCSTARVPSASTRSAPATTRGCCAPAAACELHRAVDAGQGPVLRARRADPGPTAALVLPARRLAQVRGAGGGRAARAAGGRQAGQPRHLLHRRRRHRRLPRRPDLGARPGESSTPAGATVGEHARQPPVHRRPAPRPAARRAGRRRPAALRAGHLAGDQHGHGRAARGAGRTPDHARSGPTWTEARADRAAGPAWSRSGPTASRCRPPRRRP